MTSKRLSPQHVHAVGMAAIDNAMDLMVDALLLLSAERPLRAYALGVIAVEEMTKQIQCREVLESWSGGPTAHELGQLLRPPQKAHVQRYALALQFLTLMGTGSPQPLPGWPSFDRVAQADMDARERALYVAVANDGRALTPQGVNLEEAVTWVTTISKFFSLLSGAWRQNLDKALQTALGRQQKASGRETGAG